MNIEPNFYEIQNILISYYSYIEGTETFKKLFPSPKDCLLTLRDEAYIHKNRAIQEIVLLNTEGQILQKSSKLTHKDLLFFLESNLALDCSNNELKKRDYVKIETNQKEGFINNINVGKDKRKISVICDHHTYVVLPKNVRKIDKIKSNEKNTNSINLLDAPYFIKINIEGRYYTYACFDKVTVGDYVMVSGRAQAMIHKVIEVMPNSKVTEKNKVTQEVKCVCQFDTSAYDQRVKERTTKDFKNNCNNFLKTVKTQEEIDILQKLLENKSSELMIENWYGRQKEGNMNVS